MDWNEHELNTLRYSCRLVFIRGLRLRADLFGRRGRDLVENLLATKLNVRDHAKRCLKEMASVPQSDKLIRAIRLIAPSAVQAGSPDSP